MGKFVDLFDARIRLTDKNYYRAQNQSFMTAVEWRNVEMAEEYAEFLRDGKSMFQFPYFRQLYDIWRILGKSYSAARKYHSRWELLTSEYLVASLFVATFTTLEYLPKGMLSLMLSPFFKKQNPTPFQASLAEYQDRYAKRLQTVPFYDHPYLDERNALATRYHESQPKTWGDWLTWTYTSVEMRLRRFVSIPLAAWFHQGGGSTPATTDMLVKTRLPGQFTDRAAKKLFKQHLKSAKLTEKGKRNKHVQADIVHSNLYVKPAKTKNGQTYTSVYAQLRVPRYGDFQPTVRALEKEGILPRKIAGQTQVQVKCTVTVENPEQIPAVIHRVSQAAAVETPLYVYQDRLHPGKQYGMFDVSVRELPDQLHRFDALKEDGVDVKFIHNF